MASNILDLPSSLPTSTATMETVLDNVRMEHGSAGMNMNYNGIITRIELVNFMTYRHVELKTGSHLNFITGPKYCGKSAITCAICLGLGGKPQLLNHNSTAGSFVKCGKKRAHIIIELYDSLIKKNITITRILTKEGRSNFIINKCAVDEDDVIKEVSRLNIHMNTLVQFLPEERVSYFSKLNSVQLLESMELAMGNQDLFIYHNELKSLSFENRRLKGEITAKLQQLAAEIKKVGKDCKDRKDILEHKQELRNIITKFQSLQDEVKTKKAIWLTPLEAVIDEVNYLFSKYFQHLGCVGDVVLNTDDNSENFDNYGLNVYVKFKNDLPLLEHSDAKLSMNERAVSSILFYLALQNVTQAPFRCVEINECVEPAFERKIFEIMTCDLGSSTASQSFFVTRRMLPGLEYPEDVKFHVMTNAPGVDRKVDFRMATILDNIRKENEFLCASDELNS